jgi:hypothetical protein
MYPALPERSTIFFIGHLACCSSGKLQNAVIAGIIHVELSFVGAYCNGSVGTGRK